VVVLSYRPLALWTLGYPDSALVDAEHALRDARDRPSCQHARHRDHCIGAGIGAGVKLKISLSGLRHR
jgi:hypothetical protein